MTIMICSRLHSKFLKTTPQKCKQAYNRQRNLCVTMVRKAKRNQFNNLNVRNITDNKQFWKTVKPFFSSKVSDNERITLIEEEKAVSDDREAAEIFHQLNDQRLAPGNQRFSVRVRLLAMCRSELSAVIAWLMSKCL